MDILYTKQALKDLDKTEPDIRLKFKDTIEKLPEGDVRKITGYSTAYILRLSEYRVFYEERLKKEMESIAATLNREMLVKMDALCFTVSKFINRPVTMMDEIEAVRTGRAQFKNGEVTRHEDISW